MTYDQVSAVLCAELGRPIRNRRPGLPRYVRHCPGSSDAVGDGRGDLRDHTVARPGRAADLTDDVHTVTGRAPADPRTFAHRERAAWLPQSP